MYYDDEDDDPYAPRIGPAAMPSPRSKFAPYYSGHADTFEDFLEEYEGLAYDCALTDPQRVDVIIRYVNPSLRDFWRSLSGYHSRDWPQLRQSLINIFGNPTPRHQIMKQKLRSYIQDSSRSRMLCEDDVLRYYRKFICFGIPLVHTGHLSEDERDAAFWYGFHHDDREVLRPRLLGKNPFQPSNIPFHFEDVLSCARAAFAYEDSFSPWSHAKQFEPPSLRLTRTVTTSTETTSDELSLSSHLTPFTQLPSSSSPSVSESQHTQAPSVMLNQPEPVYTLSTTLPPSDYSLSHPSSLAHSATDNDPIFASTPPSSSVSSTFLPSASPTLSRSHPHSLVHVAADTPEISSTPSPSITPAPFSMPTSDEYLPSATVDQPAPTLSSTPHPSSISSTFLLFPARLATEDQPEPETASIPSITPASTFTPTPPSSSTFLPSPVSMRSAMNSQPEIESALVSESAIPPSIDHVPEIASAPGLSLPPTLLSASKACSEVSTSLSSPTKLPPPETPTSIPAHSSRPLRSSSGDSSDAVVELVVVPVSLISSSLSLLQGESIPSLPASFEAPLIAHISPRSTPPRLPEIKTIGSVSTQLEVTPSPASPTVPPVPRQVTTAQWLLYLDPQLPGCQEPSLPHEVQLIKPPALAPRPSLFHSSGSLRRTPASFYFTLALVTAAALASILNISAIVSTFARKFQSKIEGFGNSQNSTPGYKTGDDLTHRLQLGQYTPRDSRLVFDPGGQASSSRLFSAHEDVHKRKSKIRNGFITHVAIAIPVPTDSPVFDPGGVGFVLEPAHEDLVTLDKDAQ
ncbi:hypothetical protein EDB83DRAFT_2513179 [Lactarius deliciosus]|nr:hypothetical protein EDB83DRAFT_2513179 [Lactarius deliciosus]